MYQLDVLAVAHIQEMRREAQEAWYASIARPKSPTISQRLAASTLLWAGERLSQWGEQIQGEFEPRQVSAVTK